MESHIIRNVIFQRNGVSIQPKQDTPLYKTENFDIYETFFSEYLIKVYKSGFHGHNKKMSENFLKSAEQISKSFQNGLKVYDQKELAPFTIVLMEGYQMDLESLLKKHFFTEYRDLYKFIYQTCLNVLYLEKEKCLGYHLNEKNIVQDNWLNYVVTHLDVNVNKRDQIAEQTHLHKTEVFYAPEFLKNSDYTVSSNMWDLGVMIGRILLNGETLDINYEKETIELISILEDPLIGEILKGCLEFDPQKRIRPEIVVSLINEKLSGLNEIFVNEPNEYTSDILKKTSNLDFELPNLDFLNFNPVVFPDIEIKSDAQLVELFLNPKYLIPLDLFEELVIKCWTNTERLVSFYNEVRKRVINFPNNKIILMKTLIILHSFIHKSSKNAIIVFLSENKNTNILLDIFLMIMREACKDYKRSSIIYNYAVLLVKKVEFHLKYIKIIENNFSIIKQDFYSKCVLYCDPQLIKDLFEYLQYNFLLINLCKKYKNDYFVKNVILFVLKEYYIAVSFFANVMTLMMYLSTFQSFKGEEKEKFNKRQSLIMRVIENNRRSIDTYVNEQKLDFKILGVFRTERDLEKSYLELKELLGENKENFRKLNIKAEFSVSEFYKNYLNYIINMNESSIEGKKNIRYNPTRKECKNLIKAYLNTPFEIFELKILKNLPNIINIITVQKFYQRMQEALYEKLNVKKPLEKKKNELYENEMDRDLLVKSNMEIVQLDRIYKESSTQVDLFSEKIENLKLQKDILEEELEKLKKIPKGVVEVRERVVTRKVIKKKVQEIPEIEMENVNKEKVEEFMKNEFNRSVSEWVINFSDLKIDSLISTSDRSQVYRGVYKNNDVAVKKIIKSQNQNSLKYLKTFKRELSQLVSIPPHSSLINLIGFSVHENEVYLIAEFCHGGSLFDILHKQSLDFKLTFVQKLGILICVAKGLQFLHELKIQVIHRDIKSLK